MATLGSILLLVAALAVPSGAVAEGFSTVYVGRNLRPPPEASPPDEDPAANKSVGRETWSESPGFPWAVLRHLDFFNPSSSVVLSKSVNLRIGLEDTLLVTLPQEISVEAHSLPPPRQVRAVVLAGGFEGEFTGRLLAKPYSEDREFSSGPPRTVAVDGGPVEDSCWFAWADRDTLRAVGGGQIPAWAPRWHDLERIYVALASSRRASPLPETGSFNVWLIYDY